MFKRLVAYSLAYFAAVIACANLWRIFILPRALHFEDIDRIYPYVLAAFAVAFIAAYAAWRRKGEAAAVAVLLGYAGLVMPMYGQLTMLYFIAPEYLAMSASQADQVNALSTVMSAGVCIVWPGVIAGAMGRPSARYAWAVSTVLGLFGCALVAQSYTLSHLFAGTTGAVMSGIANVIADAVLAALLLVGASFIDTRRPMARIGQ